MEFSTKQEELDYWAKIETAAKQGTPAPEHDHDNPRECEVCADYFESRKWWIENKSKETNQKLL